MPIYQYLCSDCNFSFELRQSFEDKSTTSCPRCKNTARRLFSPVPIIFKGTGFYTTDNAASKVQQELPDTVKDMSEKQD